MKAILSILFLMVTMFAIAQQEEMKKDTDGCPIFEMPEGDTIFVMKQYFFVMLKKGENRDQGMTDETELQNAHLAYLNKLDEDGYLNIAGPFGHDGDWRGILILKVPTKEEAIALVEGDPAFKAGRLSYEIYPWWGGKGSTLD